MPNPGRYAGTYRIPFYDKPPLNLNGRMHWAQERRIKTDLRAVGHALAVYHRIPRGLEHVNITLVYVPTVNRRRDEDNMMPTLKPLVDGLVDYGLVPDDTHQHVHTQCRIEPRGIRDPGLYIDIEATC
jgi:hypothetical protein